MAAPVIKTLYGNLPHPPPPKPFVNPIHNYYEALGDTATTHHYLESKATNYCTNITIEDGPDVTISNEDVITTSLQAKIPLTKELSNKAQHAFILDDLKTDSLLSIG